MFSGGQQQQQQQQQQQTPSLFGATPTTSGGGGGLFGGASQPTAPASGGLFGGGQAQTQTQTPATSTSGGLFGGAATSTTGVGGGGGGGGGGSLFGGALPPAATSAPASGGLFGTPTTTAPTTGSAPTGGLFGSAAQPTAPAQPVGGLFGAGAAASASTPATGGGLFGGGALQQPPKPLLYVTSHILDTSRLTFIVLALLLQQLLLASEHLVIQHRQLQDLLDYSVGPLLAPHSRSSNRSSSRIQFQQPLLTLQSLYRLPDLGTAMQMFRGSWRALSKTSFCIVGLLTPSLTSFHCRQEIQEQMRIATELTAHFPGHRATIDSIPSDTAVLTHKLATTKSFLAADEAALSSARQHHNEDDAAATLSIRNVDLFRVPPAQRSQYIAQQHNQPMRENDITSNKPMINYFNTQIAKMDQKLNLFLESVQEVELSLRSVEEQATMGSIGGEGLTALTGGVGGRQDARRLNRTLREFNDALKDVSGRIVDSKDGMRALRAKR